MRAIVLAAGEGSRLPGPVPKPFRLLAGKPVVGWIVDALNELNPRPQVDVIVREEHMGWATAALGGGRFSCDLIPQKTMGPAERLVVSRHLEEEALICLGDTIIFPSMADVFMELIRPSRRTVGMAYVVGKERTLETTRQLEGRLERHEYTETVDCGTYYLPDGYAAWERQEGETVLDSIIHSRGPSLWFKLDEGQVPVDVGTPEGWARAELEAARL